MKRTILLLIIICSLGFIKNTSAQKKKTSESSNLTIEERVEELMQQMTLEEKIGQMCQYVAIEHIRETKKRMKGKSLIEDDQAGMYPGMSIQELKQLVIDGKIGSFLHVKDAKEANELQELAMQSRLKIPLLIGIDAIHGHALIEGSTVFPTQLSLSSSWDNDLLYRVAKATAKEVRATGMHWTFSPNVDVARDPRWGRCGETFGEDPFMVSQMGVAFTKGYQGNFGSQNILACAKHFIAGSEPINGTNASPMDASLHQLRTTWFPPYQAQVKAGVYTFMAAHNELNGVPCHGNSFLLTDILRNEWGFEGFVVSDWMDIERLYQTQKVVPNQQEAVKMSVQAGMDMHMHGPDFLQPLQKLVKTGEVDQSRIDDACRKILKAKFLVGLFDQPFSDIEKAQKILFNQEHKDLALESSRKSIILLENKDQLLPLDNPKSILVTGPNANNHRLLGDWTLPQPEENITTIYEGIKEVFNTADVKFIDSGESLLNPVKNTTIVAQEAENYDAVVVVVGSNSLRYERQEKTCGENVDRATLNLLGNQLELIQAIYQANKQVIVVLVNGRPLATPWIKEHIPAIIEAWEPGSMGGKAVAEILAGVVNPSGKLTMTIPRSVGQVTYTYNHKPMNFFHKYVDQPTSPLWEFGHGLSYTSFQYKDLHIKNEKLQPKEDVILSAEVYNTGTVDGDEIVQVYIRDDYSTVTRPVKELVAYQRVSLKAGTSKTVTFKIPYNQLGFYNQNMEYVVEPGSFTIMVGGSSDKSKQLVETINIINK